MADATQIVFDEIIRSIVQADDDLNATVDVTENELKELEARCRQLALERNKQTSKLDSISMRGY